MRTFDGNFEVVENDEWVIECPICGREWAVKITEEDDERLEAWQRRELLIQDALPNHTPYERELIRSTFGFPMIACCEECYKENWD